MSGKRILIVGGVAGGATCAARSRRLSEEAEIVVFERGPHVSFANCGLPYFVGDVIKDEGDLLVATPELFRDRFNIDVRTRQEVVGIDRELSTIQVRNLDSGGDLLGALRRPPAGAGSEAGASAAPGNRPAGHLHPSDDSGQPAHP